MASRQYRRNSRGQFAGANGGTKITTGKAGGFANAAFRQRVAMSRRASSGAKPSRGGGFKARASATARGVRTRASIVRNKTKAAIQQRSLERKHAKIRGNVAKRKALNAQIKKKGAVRVIAARAAKRAALGVGAALTVNAAVGYVGYKMASAAISRDFTGSKKALAGGKLRSHIPKATRPKQGVYKISTI